MMPPSRVKARLMLSRKPWIDSYGNDGTCVDYYEAGKLAALQGRPIFANPGPQGDSPEAREWRRGYQAGTE